MTHHQHVGDRDCDTGWEHDFHSRTLETHYHVLSNFWELILKDTENWGSCDQQVSMCTPGLYMPPRHASFGKVARRWASSRLGFLQGPPAIPAGKEVYPNGAPPRQANKVKLYHTAQMNSPPTPLMAYNCQSVFTLTGEGTPKKFLWLTPVSYIEFVKTWRDRKEQAACPCSRDGHAQGLLGGRCSSRNKWGRVHRAVPLQALHPVASLAKLYMHKPETCNQQAHGEF